MFKVNNSGLFITRITLYRDFLKNWSQENCFCNRQSADIVFWDSIVNDKLMIQRKLKVVNNLNQTIFKKIDGADFHFWNKTIVHRWRCLKLSKHKNEILKRFQQNFSLGLVVFKSQKLPSFRKKRQSRYQFYGKLILQFMFLITPLNFSDSVNFCVRVNACLLFKVLFPVIWRWSFVTLSYHLLRGS